MNVLVVGSGGREHCLAWKLAQSPRVKQVYIAPGSAGTEWPGTAGLLAPAENVAIRASDMEQIVDWARQHEIGLAVIGPEAPLVAGLSDAFRAAGLRVFGPTAAAAQLEGSKIFAKRLMWEQHIPTGQATIWNDYEAAHAHLMQVGTPVVIKADGLAAGKGVTVCHTMAEAEQALHAAMVERVFGDAGTRVLVEELLVGQEASLLAFVDGRTVVPMIVAQDHKAAYDGDQGPNTGGMGCYAPAPLMPPALVAQVVRDVLQPVVDGMQARGIPYVGVLYAGLMLTDSGFQVLEFNCRFGDPEAQVILPLLQNDLLDIMEACIDGRLESIDVTWRAAHAACVVTASGGYPGAYETGFPVTGLEDAAGLPGLTVFHAGTRRADGQVLTAGGRVLGVTAVAATLRQALDQAYAGVERIYFHGMQYRKDIGAKAMQAGHSYASTGHSYASTGHSYASTGHSYASTGHSYASTGHSYASTGHSYASTGHSYASTGHSYASTGHSYASTGHSYASTGHSYASTGHSYASAGVNIDRKMEAIARIKEAARQTYGPAVLAGVGNFGGLYDAGLLKAAAGPVLVASTDGVGTKTKIAAAMGQYHGLGYDIVNHCINDILVQGAHPLFFLDYVASSHLEPDILIEVVAGCAEACAAAGCALLGGETAEMPGVYREGEFDLVGTIIGWVERGRLVDGHDVRPGDVCLGLPSSGLHTNGYSLARMVFAGTPWDAYMPELGTTLGESLLVIHRSYLETVDKLWNLGITIKAMAHITGGGFPDNLPRVIPADVGVHLDRHAWQPLPIFELIRERGQIDPLEMYRVFNMGMGLVLFVSPDEAERARHALADAFPEGTPQIIGQVVPWDGSGAQVQL